MFTLTGSLQGGASARRGVLQTAHGEVQTPFFMPIATKGTVKALSSVDLWELEQRIDPTTTPIVLTNTYHLLLRPGADLLNRVGGLHSWMKWPGAMLTDSGGYQVFSLSGLRKISEEGVLFQSHIDGKQHFMTPESSMEMQQAIGADMWMMFDSFPGFPATREQAKESVALTTRWAQRCAARVAQMRSENPEMKNQMFAIVQGSSFADLREQSAKELTALSADGYAIGGLAVGEPPEVMYEVLDNTVPHLPEEKPRYLMGVGMPEQILEAVKRGVDMFDCVLPTRNARHGQVFVRAQGAEALVAPDLSQVQYEKMQLANAAFEQDDRVLDEQCSCRACRHADGTPGYTRSYIRHLLKNGEPLAAQLLTEHNITFYLEMMRDIRAAIDVQL